MADHGFLISHNMLQKIAQDIVNSRKQPPKGKGEASASASVSAGTALEDPEVHVIGVHWVKRLLRHKSRFKKQYVGYEERARKAASHGTDEHVHFFLLLSNLIRRYKVLREDLWNCDEKGITMGRNQIWTIAIVRKTSNPKTQTIMTERSREFCSVLETINEAGSVVPPFIIWRGKTHQDTYNNMLINGMQPSQYLTVGIWTMR